jgi:signal recognition particle subunit SRP19
MFNPNVQFNFLKEYGIPDPIKYGPTVTDATDFSRWYCIYAQYIDAKKTIREGRRLSKEKSVENPTLDEMAEICAYFKLPYVIEYTKSYSRSWIIPGRLRVLIENTSENELDTNNKIASKRDLMLKMGELIPKLKSRCLASTNSKKSSHNVSGSSKTSRKRK